MTFHFRAVLPKIINDQSQERCIHRHSQPRALEDCTNIQCRKIFSNSTYIVCITYIQATTTPCVTSAEIPIGCQLPCRPLVHVSHAMQAPLRRLWVYTYTGQVEAREAVGPLVPAWSLYMSQLHHKIRPPPATTANSNAPIFTSTYAPPPLSLQIITLILR